jgi:hypothetical protein
MTTKYFVCLLLSGSLTLLPAAELKVATFNVDATPPLGSPLCNGAVKPVKEIVTPLTARGVVLLGAGDPIVLCAFDWVGIGNQGHDAFRAALAEGAGTSVDRVTVHTLHQHDAPGSDLGTESLLKEHGLGGRFSNAEFDRGVMQRLAVAVKQSLSKAQTITQIGLGVGKVEQVASNRRILGPLGKVILQRQSSGGKNPAAREAPEGTIDPQVRLISFWNGETPVAVLTYYATHPQSYYGQGSVNWDFVGMAREMRAEALPGVACIHFDGAGGNVAAGKYNDGAKDNRPVLAQRLADGMKLAWESQTKHAVTAADVKWTVEPVSMPVRDTLVEDALLAKIDDQSQKLSGSHPCRTRPDLPASYTRRASDSAELPPARPRACAAHARRAVCGVSARRAADASGRVRRHGGLRRLWHGLHRYRGCVWSGRLRNGDRLACGAAGGKGAHGRHAEIAGGAALSIAAGSP